MARSGAGVYSKPAGTTPADGDDIDAAPFNLLMDDIATDLNTPRPVVAGGTGASTADTALTALGGTATGTAVFKAASAAAARTTLGVTKQTSVTDTTAGSLLIVGAFGSGVVGTGSLLADLDATTTPSGEYRYDATTTGTFPTGVTVASGGVVDFNRLSATVGYETLVPTDQNVTFFRRLTTTFAAWYGTVSLLASTIADGDTIARISGIWARVAKGTAGQVYRQNDALTAPEWSDAIVARAAQATTSGTAFDFTTVPAWVKRVTIRLNGVSLSGTDNFLVQLGVAAGFVTTGYTGGGFVSTGGGGSFTASTAGFLIATNAAGEAHDGHMILTRAATTTDWLSSHTVGTVARMASGGGAITLAGPLTQVRLTRTGTDTFDAGSVSIIYE